MGAAALRGRPRHASPQLPLQAPVGEPSGAWVAS